MIYDRSSTDAERKKARAAVPTTLVPFKLLPIQIYHGEEACGPGCGEYSHQYFDPWKKGDLVVVEIKGKWWVGVRASNPSQPTVKVDLGNGALPVRVNLSNHGYRLPYRYLPIAAALVGVEFDNRQQLEDCLG